MANQPGQGKTYLVTFRPMDRVPYVHRPYPSMRFHPDGREATVQNETEDVEKCPEHEGWSKQPFTLKPKPLVRVERSAAEWKALLEERTLQYEKSWDELSAEHQTVKRAFAEKVFEIQALGRQLNDALDQIRALTPAPGVELPAEPYPAATQPEPQPGPPPTSRKRGGR